MLARATGSLARSCRLASARPLPSFPPLSKTSPVAASPHLAFQSFSVLPAAPKAASSMSSGALPVATAWSAAQQRNAFGDVSGTRSMIARRMPGHKHKVQRKPSTEAPAEPDPRTRKKKGRNPKEAAPEIPPCPERVVCAVVLGRIPQITPEVRAWEKDFLDLQDRKTEVTGAQVPEEWWGQDEGLSVSEEEEELVIHPRRTEHDEAKNHKALERALDTYIYLLVKKTPAESGDPEWGFPSVERQPGEAMRDAVQRTLHTHIGDTANTWPVGFFPMHFLDVGSGPSLRRVFYFRVCLVHGPYVCNRELVQDFAWVTRQELKEYLGEGAEFAAAYDVTDD